MTEMQFCYCCRVHHPKAQMRLFPTRHGMRWRCLRSIEAAATSQQARDAFGRQQSVINSEASRLQCEFAARHQRAEAARTPARS